MPAPSGPVPASAFPPPGGVGLPRFGGLLAAAVLLTSGLQPAAAVDDIRFGRDILPILAENCFACHGPDEEDRHAGLRLDTFEGATALIEGHAAVVPGDPAAGTLVQRIVSTDPDEVMPPPKSHKPPLDADQAALLVRWIEQGAPWGRHWSLELPQATPLPPITRPADNAIDAWINHQLEREGFEANGPAASHSRVRRLSFALTGLPPDPEDIERFVGDPSPETWRSMVRKYLDSPNYGERMAMWWLDAARYSDTDGFQIDENRTNWPWRDWVIDAFNSNMPFDRFTLEQFAGDLLPDPTPEQIIATAFHRHHMTNGEGGRDPEESRIDYVIDRINTIGSVWLGTTLACAHCHTHKYDPVSHAEYFSLAAFFNSIDEDGRAGRGAKPYHNYKSPHVARARGEAGAVEAETKAALQQAREAATEPFIPWLDDRLVVVGDDYRTWHRFGETAWSTDGTELVPDPRSEGFRAQGPDPNHETYLVAGRMPDALERINGFRLHVLPVPEDDLPDGIDEQHGRLARGGDGWFVVSTMKARVRVEGSAITREIDLVHAVADVNDPGAKRRGYGNVQDTLNDDARNGWTTAQAAPGEARVAQFAFAEPWVPTEGEELVIEIGQRSTDGHANIARFRLEVIGEPGAAARSLGPTPLQRLAENPHQSAADVSGDLRKDLFEQFLVDHAPFQAAKARHDRAVAQLNEIKRSEGVDVMVLAEREQPRPTHILIRGEWDQKGDVVEPGVIEALGPWPEGEPLNRIGLARWITSPENPMTARVIVNHLWTLMFGNGLVRTVDDFGLLGEHPSHPELLDHLALEFIASGWDVKAMIETMVTSEAWQRDSHVRPDHLERDPFNRLLARGPRFRLPSWMLRDAALHHADLLNDAIGGPPVRPYQPEGIWEEITMGRFTYHPSLGPAQYRRSVYAFWRRSSAPTFLFDSAQRRVCEVNVPRSNTPLHALVMLNEGTQLEAARALADVAMAQAADAAADRLRQIFEKVTARSPEEPEMAVLMREHVRALDHWQQHPDEARKFISVGQRPPADEPAATAAIMLIASMILNLDEAIHHE